MHCVKSMMLRIQFCLLCFATLVSPGYFSFLSQVFFSLFTEFSLCLLRRFLNQSKQAKKKSVNKVKKMQDKESESPKVTKSHSTMARKELPKISIHTHAICVCIFSTCNKQILYTVPVAVCPTYHAQQCINPSLFPI